MDCDAYRDDLMDVLYGEADPATARRFQEHQARCAACREETASLRRVRRDLDGWVLAPRVASRVKPLLRPRYLAAAAAVLLSLAGGALVLAKGELRYPNGQVAFRVAAPAPEVAELRQLLREQEARHQQALVELRTAQPASAAAGDRDALLREVARLVHESETRQSAAVAASLSELADRTETQRRVDFAQMSAGLSLLESRTGLQAARTTELMGKVVLASQGK
jgi:putative zinc finger protein